jgi:hypothetical protein
MTTPFRGVRDDNILLGGNHVLVREFWCGEGKGKSKGKSKGKNNRRSLTAFGMTTLFGGAFGDDNAFLVPDAEIRL